MIHYGLQVGPKWIVGLKAQSAILHWWAIKKNFLVLFYSWASKTQEYEFFQPSSLYVNSTHAIDMLST